MGFTEEVEDWLRKLLLNPRSQEDAALVQDILEILGDMRAMKQAKYGEVVIKYQDGRIVLVDYKTSRKPSADTRAA